MNNSSYKNYKSRLKIQCIVQIAATAVALLALIFLFFLPNFEIDMRKVPDGIKTTLPKIENQAEDLFGDIGNADDLDDILNAFNKSLNVEFSLYDEIYASFNPVNSEDEELSGVGLLQIMCGIILLAAAVASLFSIGKNLTGIISSDNYAIKTYDSIKRREKKSRYAWIYSPTYLFVWGISCELAFVLMTRYLNKFIETKYATSYFTLVTGLSGVAAVPIIFTLIAAGGFIAAKILKSRIAADIYREEYGEKPAANETENVFDL